jgi:pimeloyl-ACP methyl ester carboxylesterase
MTAATYVVENFQLGSFQLQAITAGSGRPLLILHEEMGYSGWMDWHDDLARDHSLVIPLAPGFGWAPRIEWIQNIRDLASVYARLLRERDFAPIDVIGFSLGGWIVAEMAVFDSALFRRMVLVAPLGIRPEKGEILDAFSLTHHAQLHATVFDAAATPEFGKLYGGASTPEQIEALDDARAESARLAWQPYLYNPSLPYLLEGVGAKLPTLLIWGEQDRVVPVSTAETYRSALGTAQVLNLPKCGHRPEIEHVTAFVAAVRQFLA